MKTKTNAIKGFYCGVITLALILLLVILVTIQQHLPFSLSSIYMLILLGIMGLFIFGNIYTIKGLRDPYSLKKWIGIVLNGLFTLVFFALILANFFDLYSQLR
jgi:hypothetical protein